MTSARKLVQIKRQKAAYYDALIMSFGPNGVSSESRLLQELARIRRKGPVDAMNVMLTCIDYGFCHREDSGLKLDEVTDKMLQP